MPLFNAAPLDVEPLQLNCIEHLDLTTNQWEPVCPSPALQADISRVLQPVRNDHLQSLGYVTGEWFAFVQTPVNNLRSIPKARDAVDAEWNKLLK